MEKNNKDFNEDKIIKKNKGKEKLKPKNLFNHTTFSVVFSIVASFIIWFIMAANNDLNRTVIVYDVPIQITLSELAQSEGIKVFAQQYETADVSIEGNNLITNAITSADITVVAELSPASVKLSSNDLISEVVTLTATKTGNTISEYSFSNIFPNEIEIVYDKYDEKSFVLENEISYTTDDVHFVNTPVFSHNTIVVSGPKSSVSNISRVAINHDLDGTITESQSFASNITVYDLDNNVMDLDGTYLEFSTENVDVTMEVLNKKTVELNLSTLNMPEGFSSSRISIEPATLDIAGDQSALDEIDSIELIEQVDFKYVTPVNNQFEIEIPLPVGVRNINNISSAVVTFDLDQLDQASISTENIQFINVPENIDVQLVTKSITVDVIGSTAQISRLTADSIYGTINMAGNTDKDGTFEFPVVFNVPAATSGWITGNYTAYVTVSSTPLAAVASDFETSSEDALTSETE